MVSWFLEAGLALNSVWLEVLRGRGIVPRDTRPASTERAPCSIGFSTLLTALWPTAQGGGDGERERAYEIFAD